MFRLNNIGTVLCLHVGKTNTRQGTVLCLRTVKTDDGSPRQRTVPCLVPLFCTMYINGEENNAIKKRGFTLAELLIVTAIIAVLTATATYSFHPRGIFYLMRVYVHGFSYKQKDLSKWLISTEWEVNGSKIPMVWNPDPLNPSYCDPSVFWKNYKYLEFTFVVYPGSSVKLLAVGGSPNIA